MLSPLHTLQQHLVKGGRGKIVHDCQATEGPWCPAILHTQMHAGCDSKLEFAHDIG